jgi:hypothetical protein
LQLLGLPAVGRLWAYYPIDQLKIIAAPGATIA